MFKALVLDQVDKKTTAEVKQLEISDLPDEEVLVDIAYSSLNYKDGMAVTGTGKIVRDFPMVPGIDFAGTVSESASERYQPGDEVILTGWSVGERYWGGYSQKERVKADWLVPMPDGLDARKAMTIGTAGLTATLCVMTLEEAGVKPDSGKVLVTGAAGGVGSIAVLLLSQLGYQVTAVTGRPDTHEYQRLLGASDFISREEMAAAARPLETQKWAGAVDVVGGDMLARVLAEMDYNGAVAACGLAGDFKLSTTVMPFILRNVSLRGVDSVMCPPERRTVAWERLASELPEEAYSNIGKIISLEEVVSAGADIVAGKVKGRVLVDPNL
ncbi:acrylyl-CoA reductase (NADPH) [Solemya velum gill symbiont]|uniref:acrylyl-CoA reductase (NADPH) n=1 Tax=Solemya velum gill symbiont TaxID=2340 RepID=UPI000998E6A2|nr:MDR family oxidoreductase [Solemya velum gill symbiont]OOY98345.1 oxidoreductase [Solemya velum gill symbiont]OOZ00662.1 oxidoreductase [Solemya velum gill symbiont]OOZ02828.1 oxidoreductase [Solemya velum gill symbiont]OOZ05079.1 oxidoreductase [Solemya velum gill symbiont]OOZ07318.1 oxidoreductase [Solemya velum gill symbiont]